MGPTTVLSLGIQRMRLPQNLEKVSIYPHRPCPLGREFLVKYMDGYSIYMPDERIKEFSEGIDVLDLNPSNYGHPQYIIGFT